MKTIKIKNWEYTIEDEQKGKRFDDIVIPKGWKLWDSEDCIKFHNNEKLREKLNLNDCWFFIKKPFKINKPNKWVAWFGAYSDRAGLACGRDPGYPGASLGVRFKRKIQEKDEILLGLP